MRCPKCKAAVPSAAEMCGECGYAFPSPDDIELVTIPNLILMAATLISIGACLFSAFVVLVTIFSTGGPSAWSEMFPESIAGVILSAAMTIVFVRTMR